MTNKIVLIGNGAREHAIAVALKSGGARIFSFMGKKNPGIAKISEKFEIGKLDDVSKLIPFAKTY